MPDLAVSINSAGAQLVPGGAATITVEVRNLGSVVDRYRCDIVGIDPTWVTVTPASIELFPAREGADPARGDVSRPDTPPSVGRFTVSIHPPRTSAATAGPWTFGAKVQSEHNPTNRLVEEATVVFLPFGALEADLRPAIAAGRFGAKTTLALANRGNRPETVEVSGSDRADKIAFDIRPASLGLAAGETAGVPIKLSSGGAKLVGGTDTRPFSVLVRANSADTPPVALTGTLEKRPIIPSGLPVAIATLVALGLGAFAVWAAFIRPGPPGPTPAPVASIAIIASPTPAATPPPTAAPTPTPATPAPTPPPTPTPICPPSPIDDDYSALGGPGSFLGAMAGCDTAIADGAKFREFAGGTIYLAPGATKAFALQKDLATYWKTLGAGTSALGYPVGDSLADANGDGGWSANFSGGKAWWTPATGGGNCSTTMCFIIVHPSLQIFLPNP
jgi:hypothetical protein